MKNLGIHPDFPKVSVFADKDFCCTEPYPTKKDLSDFYRSKYREIRAETPNADYIHFMKMRAGFQKQFIEGCSDIRFFSRILDIGSGCGALLHALSPIGDSLQGWEPDHAMFEFSSITFANERISFVNGLFDHLMCHEQYDLITMSHVLEHVPQPHNFLSALVSKTLSPGGCLFIEVPNDPPHWVEKQIQWRLRGMAHLNYFTQSSLESHLKESGFKILACRHCGNQLDIEIRKMRPLTRLERAFRKVRRLLRKDNINSEVSPDYSPANQKNGVYLQALAQRVID
ncbi:MAG: class I SAM-dependent methyltransferase [Verrucomicrobiae bacterium]